MESAGGINGEKKRVRAADEGDDSNRGVFATTGKRRSPDTRLITLTRMLQWLEMLTAHDRKLHTINKRDQREEERERDFR